MRPGTLAVSSRRVLSTLVVATVLGAACTSSDDDDGAASRATTTRPRATTTSIFRPPVTVPGIPRTTSSIPTELQGGGASLSGTVVGPDGPAAGATVRIERFVGSQVVGTDVAVPSGDWQLLSVHGGRYRVRAWRVPDLAQLQPEVFFLGADETTNLSLRVDQVGDLSATATVDPDPPLVGSPATLVLQLFGGAVDSQGVVHGSSLSSTAVQLVLTGSMILESPDRALTDELGNARFTVRCRDAGTAAGTAIVGAAQVPVSLPTCGGP